MTNNNEIDLEKLQECIDYLSNDPEIECAPYPNYPDVVWQCFSFLPTDFNYLDNHNKLGKKAISRMNKEQLATMFTYISRGERFCDGHIMVHIENGVLLKLLLRLKKIVEKENKTK